MEFETQQTERTDEAGTFVAEDGQHESDAECRRQCLLTSRMSFSPDCLAAAVRYIKTFHFVHYWHSNDNDFLEDCE